MRTNVYALRRLMLLAAFTTFALVLATNTPDRRAEPAPSTTVPTTTTSTTTTTTLPPPPSSTTSTTTTTLPPGDWQCPDVIRLAAALWPADELDMVDRVAYRESRCQPGAENLSYLQGGRDYSLGLFQINILGSLWDDRAARCSLSSPVELYDAATNVRCAHILWVRSGWAPWGF